MTGYSLFCKRSKCHSTENVSREFEDTSRRKRQAFPIQDPSSTLEQRKIFSRKGQIREKDNCLYYNLGIYSRSLLVFMVTCLDYEENHNAWCTTSTFYCRSRWSEAVWLSILYIVLFSSIDIGTQRKRS